MSWSFPAISLNARGRGSSGPARTFLDLLPQPQLIVPGNHDVPLHNVLARFFSPLRKYRRHMTDDLQPSYVDEEIALIGTDTTRSFTIGGGGIRNASSIAFGIC
jgi:hypothetical protein